MQPVYPDLNMATDDSSIVELGFVVEANFLIQPKLIEPILEGIICINTQCVHHVSRLRIPFSHNSNRKSFCADPNEIAT